MGSAGDYKKEYTLRLIFPDVTLQFTADDGHAIVDEEEILFFLSSALGNARRREAIKVRRKAIVLEQARVRRLAKAAAKLKPGADTA